MTWARIFALLFCLVGCEPMPPGWDDCVMDQEIGANFAMDTDARGCQ